MSPRTDHCFRRAANAFTLIEVLVACVILALILVITAGMVDSLQKLSGRTFSKVEAFREARTATELIASSISQAELNTYLDYINSNGNYRLSTQAAAASFVPSQYVRTSELRFLSGGNLVINGGPTTLRPTHSIFFQAPLGFVSAGSGYRGLGNLLNSIGYYIEFNNDSAGRPDFFANLPNPPPPVYRYRLMAAVQPSDQLTIYNYTGGNPGLKSSDPNGKAWLTDTLASNPHVVADNIIALVIIPRLGTADQAAGGYQDSALAPDYAYDSTRAKSDPALNSLNQLPPVLNITLIAVDEHSFARFQNNSATPRDLGLDSLFQLVGDLKDPSNPGYAKDIETLKSTLVRNRIDYRIFTIGVPIKAARWSKNQKN